MTWCRCQQTDSGLVAQSRLPFVEPVVFLLRNSRVSPNGDLSVGWRESAFIFASPLNARVNSCVHIYSFGDCTGDGTDPFIVPACHPELSVCVRTYRARVCVYVCMCVRACA